MFEPGTKLGSYEIVASEASSSGAEVYKATDVSGTRAVSIRVLPPEWTAGEDSSSRRQSFDRAARSVAALNHPNIRQFHEAGKQDGVEYLVLEHLEGRTLAERLGGKPLPLKEALDTAIAIADALDKAHGAGVVHREFNPANVMLTKDGVKLLELAISELKPAPPPASGAKKIAAADSGRKSEESGALNYMAPEQVEGKAGDARSDVFSFGALLYEMISGRKACEGKSRAVLIAAIATADPDPLAHFQPKTPRLLQHIVDRCLEKDPDDRGQTAHDLLVQLRYLVEGGAKTLDAAANPGLGRMASIGLIAAGLALVALAYPAARLLRGSAAREALQFRVPVAGLSMSDIALSPDGQTLALVAPPTPPIPPRSACAASRRWPS